MHRKKSQDYLNAEEENSKLCSNSQYRYPLELLKHKRVCEVFDSVKASANVLVWGKNVRDNLSWVTRGKCPVAQLQTDEK